MRSRHGDTPQPLRAGPRKLNYGLSRDSFEAAHRVLDYLDILDVISDYRRSKDGKVDGWDCPEFSPPGRHELPNALSVLTPQPCAATVFHVAQQSS